MVLLRKRTSQIHNLKTAAELGVKNKASAGMCMDLRSEEGKALLHSRVYEFSERFFNAHVELKNLSLKRSEILGKRGLTDSKLILVQTMSNQVYGEFQDYYLNAPDSQFDAICWLQKVFFLCRMFESETYIECSNSRHVGKMIEPITGKNFKELTSIDNLTMTSEDYGANYVNQELQKLVNAALALSNPTQAVRLLCDSVKHGVLSPAIDLALLKSSRQIYIIGLGAMIQSVELFNNRFLRLLSEKSVPK